MPAIAALSHYLAFLREAPIVPKPRGEIWSDMIRRTSVTGLAAEIDEEIYDWFLDCLPPKWQGHGFAFAEGAESLRYFWKHDGRFFVRQLTWEETKAFCQAAGIPLPS